MKTKFRKQDMPRAIAWFAAAVDGMKDGKEYTVEIKEYRRKRSLDANAYCWVLIDKLAEKLHHDLKTDRTSVKEQIYRHAIKDIGGVSDTVCAPDKAVESIINGWQSKGLGWQTETFKSKIDGCTNITLYYGSSTYDSKQMSRLIDSIVQECKTVGIETMPPDKLKGLIEQWK